MTKDWKKITNWKIDIEIEIKDWKEIKNFVGTSWVCYIHCTIINSNCSGVKDAVMTKCHKLTKDWKDT